MLVINPASIRLSHPYSIYPLVDARSIRGAINVLIDLSHFFLLVTLI